MNTTSKNAFVNQLLVYTLVVLFLSGSAGLGAVWMRHQISVTANQTRQTEIRLAQTERRLAELSASIAAEQSPEVLERRNQEMRLGLARPSEPQVVRVAVSAERRLAAKRNAEIFTDEAASAAPAVRFTVADNTGNRRR